MKLTDQQRAELKALADAATPGPWEVKDSSGAGLEIYMAHYQAEDKTWPAFSTAHADYKQGLITYEQWVQFPNEKLDNVQTRNALFIAAANPATTLAMLADLEEEKTRTSHYKDVAEQINSELELVRAEKEIVRGFVTERDGIIAKMQAELAATRQLAEATTWRPIETAPLDGTTVIIGRDMGIFGFVRGFGHFEGVPGSFVSGWISQGFNEFQGNLGLAQPSHWMPLPAAPNYRARGEKGGA